MPSTATTSVRGRPRVAHVALSALLASTVSLAARPTDGEVLVGIRGGAAVPTSDLSLPEHDVPLDVGSTYAVEAALAPWPNLALEMRWQQAFTTANTGPPPATDAALDVGALTAGLRYLVGTRGDPIRPYASGHVGWYRATGRVSGARGRDQTLHGDTMGCNAAIGVSLPLTGALSADLEVRYHFTAELQMLTPLAGLTLAFDP